MTDHEFEASLRAAVAAFCSKHGPEYQAEVIKLPELWEITEELLVPAYEVVLRWIPPIVQAPKPKSRFEGLRLSSPPKSNHDSGVNGKNVFREFSDLINAPPYAVVDDDGSPLPNSFIWTVGQRDLLNWD